jgi:hypothetical protein
MPNDGQEGQDEIVQVEFDERFRSWGIEICIIAEEKVSGGGDQNEEEGVLERKWVEEARRVKSV